MIEQNSSFLDNIPQHIVDAEVQEISEMLFDEWLGNNLEDGQFWSDYRFAEKSSSRQTKDEFNKHWEIKEGEEYYL